MWVISIFVIDSMQIAVKLLVIDKIVCGWINVDLSDLATLSRFATYYAHETTTKKVAQTIKRICLQNKSRGLLSLCELRKRTKRTINLLADLKSIVCLNWRGGGIKSNHNNWLLVIHFFLFEATVCFNSPQVTCYVTTKSIGIYNGADFMVASFLLFKWKHTKHLSTFTNKSNFFYK